MNKTLLGFLGKQVEKWLTDLEPTEKVPFRHCGGYVHLHVEWISK